MSGRESERDMLAAQPPRHLEALVGAEADVEDRRIERLLVSLSAVLQIVRGAERLMAEILQPILRQHGDERLVVDDQKRAMQPFLNARAVRRITQPRSRCARHKCAQPADDFRPLAIGLT